MNNQEMLDKLTQRRTRLQKNVDEYARQLAALKEEYEHAEAALMQNEIEIDEFKRECFTSPKIDTLKIESRVRTALKKAGIQTVYELRYYLRHDYHIGGLGDVSRERLRQLIQATA